MINIKDKLNRTNILIKRPNNVDVEYVPSNEFEADIKAINGRINELEDVDTSDYVTKSELNNQIDELKRELGTKKIDATGFKFATSTFAEFPDMFDFSNVSDFNYMFSGCENLTRINVNLDGAAGESTRSFMFADSISLIEAPEIDTTLTTDMSGMYQSCESLEKVPSYNIDVCASLSDMFNYCSNLVEVGDFTTYSGTATELLSVYFMFSGCRSLVQAPNIPTKNVEDFVGMFDNCSALETVPEYNFSKANNVANIFNGCYNLTNFGGFKNIKIDLPDNCGLVQCWKLSYESLINIINGLYNFRANGDNITTRTIKLNYMSISKLTEDDIAMATSKGWVITGD